jgi:hypothetical protein
MWPTTVPILSQKDISSHITNDPNKPKCLASHMTTLFSLSEITTVAGAIALAHHVNIQGTASLKFNAAMAYLGYTEGQEDVTLALSTKMRTLTLRTEYHRRIVSTNASQERKLQDGANKPRAPLAHSRRSPSRIRRAKPNEATANDGQVLPGRRPHKGSASQRRQASKGRRR